MVDKNYPNKSEEELTFEPNNGYNFSNKFVPGRYVFLGSNTELRSLRDALKMLVPTEPA
jgi:hypothetical protein